MGTLEQLKQFLEPQSIAIIGASRSTGEGAYNVLENLLGYGYQGRVYPVNPNANEILGVKTYSKVGELPEKVDLAIVSLPRTLVPGVVKECVDEGISAMTIVTQGFGDADDDEGKRLQGEIDRLVEGRGVRVLGPNTFGTANAHIKFSSSFIKTKMAELPVGLICQTGAFFVGFGDLKLLGKGVDVGDACDVDAADALEYFEQDEDTKVIALHVEGVRDGRRFLEVVSRVAEKKPVVALKTGRSKSAARAVQSHTGALAGRDEVWDTALRSAGVIRAIDIEDFCDAIMAFCVLPRMRGRRVGITTYTGGFGIMGVDACERCGLELAELSAATVEGLSALSPPWLAVGNPLDIWPGNMISGHPLSQMEEAAVRSLLADPKVDAVLCIFAAYKPALHFGLRRMVEEAAESHPEKPVVFYIYGPFYEEVKKGLEATGRTRVFSSFDRAACALGHVASYSGLSMKR